MKDFIVKRIIKFVTLLAAISIVTFTLMKLSPIDPVTAYVGADGNIGAAQRELIAQKWGLDKPPVQQFLSWAGSMLKGDWGNSIVFRRPVMEVVGQKFTASLALMFFAWIISGAVGFALGIIAGVFRESPADKLIRLICHVLMSTPSFWLGILSIMLFCVWIPIFPVALSVPIGVVASEVTLADRVIRIILPSLTLGLSGIANICMHTREKTVEIMSSDYILFAMARGESMPSIVFGHLLRNVSLPAITLQFLSFSELFGGAVFVEQVFSYPGLGQAAVQAGIRGDVPLLMAIAIISMVFVFVGNTMADLLYRIIDPRIVSR